MAKAQLFEKVDDLNAFLENRKLKNVVLLFKSVVVGERVRDDGTKVYEIVDRFLAVED